MAAVLKTVCVRGGIFGGDNTRALRADLDLRLWRTGLGSARCRVVWLGADAAVGRAIRSAGDSSTGRLDGMLPDWFCSLSSCRWS